MRSTILMISLALATACSGIEGDWSGEMKCKDMGSNQFVDDGESPSADFNIEMNEFGDTEFEGRMSNALTCRQDNDDTTDDIKCDFVMVGTIGSAERNIDGGVILRVDSCTADGGELGSIGFGCEDPTTTWEGRSLKIDHQTSGDVLCRIELERQ
jgi:hypothetical protein